MSRIKELMAGTREIYITVKKNYALVVVLIVCALACISTGVLMDFHLIPGGKPMKAVFKTIHTYSGYIMAVGLVVHISWHKEWIRSATRQWIGKK